MSVLNLSKEHDRVAESVVTFPKLLGALPSMQVIRDALHTTWVSARIRHRARISAKQLRHVDRRFLSDIGIEPNDIDQVASALAYRSAEKKPGVAAKARP